MVELELKFLVDAAHRQGVEAKLRALAPKRVRLMAHYHDTSDGRLASHRVALRLRKEGTVWMQTLKAAGESDVHRLEHNVTRPGRWGANGPPLDLSLHAGTPAGAALQRALQSDRSRTQSEDVSAATLQCIYSTDIWRRAARISWAGCEVEIAFDQGQIVANGASTPVCEIEYEWVSGDVSGLYELARRDVAAHGLWLSTVSKAEQGERLARGTVHVPATRAVQPRLRKRMDLAQARQRAVAACVAQVLPNASEVASGHGDAEHVHQLRVGLRRLRVALRELRAPSDEPASPHGAPELAEADLEALIDAFRALGTSRDANVVVDAFERDLDAAGAPPRAQLTAQGHGGAAVGVQATGALGADGAADAADAAGATAPVGATAAPGVPAAAVAPRDAVPDDQDHAQHAAEGAVAAVRAIPFQHALIGLIALLHPGAVASTSAPESSDGNVNAIELDSDSDSSPASTLAAASAKRLTAAPSSKPEHSLPRRVAKRLERLHRRIVVDAVRLAELAETDRHRLRKRLKRLRYLAELTGSLYGRKPVQRYLKALKPAQTALGALNDRAVARSACEERAASAADRRAWFALGLLAGTDAAALHEAQGVLAGMKKVAPYWRS